MGNRNSVENHTDFSDISTNYSYEVKYTDKRFGEIKLMKRKGTGEKIFQKDFSSNSANEFQENIKKIQQSIPLAHPNLIKILGYNSKKEDFFCADFYKINLFFESFETDLEKEISKRSTSKNYFTENELKCILDSVVTAGAFLQNNQIAHGDIRPFNIFITKSKDYKLCDISLFSPIYNPSHIGVLDTSEIKSHLPGPQLIKNIKGKDKKAVEFDQYKNDVYGLGLSLLMAAQLGKVDNLYNYEKKEINRDSIERALDKIEQRYSQDFVETISILLNAEERNRPNFIEIDNEMKAYRADIRARANLERNLEMRRQEQEEEEHQRQQQDQEQEHELEGEHHKLQEKNKQSHPQKEVSAPQAKSSPTTVTSNNPSPVYFDDEIDRRVRRAVEQSEQALYKSPTKYKNDVIDNCVNTYLQKDYSSNEKPLLYTLSPYLTMDRRFQPSLRVYSHENQQLQASQYHIAEVGSNLYGSLATAASHHPRGMVARDGRLSQAFPVSGYNQTFNYRGSRNDQTYEVGSSKEDERSFQSSVNV